MLRSPKSDTQLEIDAEQHQFRFCNVDLQKSIIEFVLQPPAPASPPVVFLGSAFAKLLVQNGPLGATAMQNKVQLLQNASSAKTTYADWLVFRGKATCRTPFPVFPALGPAKPKLGWSSTSIVGNLVSMGKSSVFVDPEIFVLSSATAIASNTLFAKLVSQSQVSSFQSVCMGLEWLKLGIVGGGIWANMSISTRLFALAAFLVNPRGSIEEGLSRGPVDGAYVAEVGGSSLLSVSAGSPADAVALSTVFGSPLYCGLSLGPGNWGFGKDNQYVVGSGPFSARLSQSRLRELVSAILSSAACQEANLLVFDWAVVKAGDGVKPTGDYVELNPDQKWDGKDPEVDKFVDSVRCWLGAIGAPDDY